MFYRVIRCIKSTRLSRFLNPVSRHLRVAQFRLSSAGGVSGTIATSHAASDFDRTCVNIRTEWSPETTDSMELPDVVTCLKQIADPSLAGDWDNVGLLVEPSPPHRVRRILLTNDLTPEVMQEAEQEEVNMIVSYHPPIFGSLKRLTQRTWKEKLIIRCLEKRIAVYSPHTSWDAAVDGVNDWLIGAFGDDIQDKKPLEQTEILPKGTNKRLSVVVSEEEAKLLLTSLQWLGKDQVYCENQNSSNVGDASGTVKLHVSCKAADLSEIMKELTRSGITLQHLECTDSAKLPSPGFGMGRSGRFRSSISIETAISHIKDHLGLQHVRIAKAPGQIELTSVAVCAGSGSSVLRGVKADLYLTGEMSHHDVLDAVCKGTSVVLCDHSNTERGFLKVVQGRLQDVLKSQVEVLVSLQDSEPLKVM